MELDDIHRRHCKASTVHHATDLAVQPHIVQVRFGSLHFTRVFHRCVPHSKQIFVAVGSVLVKVDLSVHAKDLPILGFHKGVDLDLCGVASDEQVVQVFHLGLGIFQSFSLKAQSGRHVMSLAILNTFFDVDRLCEDCVGVFLCYLLDIHSTLLGSHNDGSVVGAVHQNSEIQFTVKRDALVHKHLLAQLAFWTRLFGDQVGSKHVLRQLSNLLCAIGTATDLDAAFEPVVEMAFATAASVDLRFQDQLLCVLSNQAVGNGQRFFTVLRHEAFLDPDVVLVHQLFGLVLVEVQVADLSQHTSRLPLKQGVCRGC
mmetsp:Transcript_9631/g.14035  ORF Transcript_9631/g.14035 Transcript_9631/m.14035 type:complete len:314 (-) Transcript_9631:93-1034(-)